MPSHPPHPSPRAMGSASVRLVMLGLALPATLALVPGHPYGRSLRPRAADVRWPGVVAMAEGDPGEAPTKRADELLRALQNADMRGVEPKEEEEPDFLSAAGLQKEFALLRKGEGVRAAPSNLKRSGPHRLTLPRSHTVCRRRTSSSRSSCRPSPSSSRSGCSSSSRATSHHSPCSPPLRSMTSSPSRRCAVVLVVDAQAMPCQ